MVLSHQSDVVVRILLASKGEIKREICYEKIGSFRICMLRIKHNYICFLRVLSGLFYLLCEFSKIPKLFVLSFFGLMYQCLGSESVIKAARVNQILR
jgi:hypothetical protein